MKRSIGAATLAMGLSAVSGCMEPPEIVPVTPPGVQLQRALPAGEAEGGQALGESNPQTQTGAAIVSSIVSPPTKVGETAKTKEGLEYTTIKEGTGADARPGQTVKVKYAGTFPDGNAFDSGEIKFQLGTAKVIPGWDQGISGMKVGEQRKLTIPPNLAYGPSGQPPKIPADATLLFDVELQDVK